GRVQPLVILPELGSILALVLVFLVFGAIESALAEGSSLTAAAVNTVVLRLVVFCGATLAIPFSMSLSNRVETLAGRGFLRALTMAESGFIFTIVPFFWVLLAISALRG
ncbi:MAG TPA: hypothetical protein VJP06_01985, partial [Thermoplasmata archaeon]|nr:hypothetical protein [Thermoplasmata archaeon]